MMTMTDYNRYIENSVGGGNYDNDDDSDIMYISMIQQSQPALDNVSQFAKGYEDYLQCPLQVQLTGSCFN